MKLLQWLWLSSNQIGNGGCTALSHGLRGLNLLNTLYLHENMIGDDGATALGEALQNKKFEDFDITRNMLSVAGRKRLRDSIVCEFGRGYQYNSDD